MRFVSRNNIGDAIWLTGLVREFHRTYPNERLFVDSPGKDELFLHNPYLVGGTEERHSILNLNPAFGPAETVGNGVVSYCMQAGVDAYETTPEIWFVPKELEEGVRLIPHGNYVVAIDTWAMWPSRRWAFGKFVELSTKLRGLGWKVIEIGRTMPDDLGHVSVKRIPSDVCLFDKLTLRQAAAALAACSLFIGNDSGMMHLAAAVGTPQVGIFGVKPWYCRAYPSTYPVFRAARCYPQCFIECSQVDHPCMSCISVERVLNAAERAYAFFRKTKPKVWRG